LADLVVVDGDPSANIGVLSDAANVVAVMKGGRFLKGGATGGATA
jgi:imidazolonepropionase-like amidohydrolase